MRHCRKPSPLAIPLPLHRDAHREPLRIKNRIDAAVAPAPAFGRNSRSTSSAITFGEQDKELQFALWPSQALRHAVRMMANADTSSDALPIASAIRSTEGRKAPTLGRDRRLKRP